MTSKFEKRIKLLAKTDADGCSVPIEDWEILELIDEARKEFPGKSTLGTLVWFEKWFGNEKKTGA